MNSPDALPWHLLLDGLATLGLPFDPSHLAAFQRYAALLVKWGAALRLTGTRDPHEWIETHFLDSLTPLPDLEGATSLLDIGSGAGFPGLPLAIVRPDLTVTLLETYGKKATFLRTAVHELGLSRVTVRNARAEDSPSPQFGAVISRALCAPAAWLPMAVPWTRPGGRILSMLGREVPADEDLRELAVSHGCTFSGVRRFHLPHSGAHRAIARWERATPGPPAFSP